MVILVHPYIILYMLYGSTVTIILYVAMNIHQKIILYTSQYMDAEVCKRRITTVLFFPVLH